MIVNVGLSPTSLADVSKAKLGPHGMALQRTMGDWLRSHGSIIFATARDASEFVRLVKTEGEFSEAERKEWSALLTWLRGGGRLGVAQPAYAGLDGLTDAAAVDAGIPHRPFIAVVSHSVFDQLYPGNTDGWAPTAPDLDVTISATVSLTRLVSRTQAVAARESYAAGIDREAVWDELLRSLASQSKRVTLFDRYIFAKMCQRDGNGDATPEHLEWLLDKLSVHAPQGTFVKVYGATGYQTVPKDAAAVAHLLNARWTPTGNRLAGVELVTLKAPQWLPHDRHMTFGETMGLELPSGLDRLASPHLHDTFSFGYKWRNEQLQSLRDRVSRVDHRHPVVTKVI